MKVVETDNFGGDYPNEKFVRDRPCGDDEARAIAIAMNEAYSGPNADRYWKVVADDYVLQPGFEP